MAATGSRVTQAAKTTWSEIKGGPGEWVWHVPKDHLKGRMIPVDIEDGREEWPVPLPDALVDFLGLDNPGKPEALVFHTPRSKTGRIAPGTLRYALNAAGANSSPNGWRSTLGDYCRKSKVDAEVRELCMGHRPTKSSVANRYTGTDRFEDRKEALERWVDFFLP